MGWERHAAVPARYPCTYCPTTALAWPQQLPVWVGAGAVAGGGAGEPASYPPLPPGVATGAGLNERDVAVLAEFVRGLAVQHIIPNLETRIRALNHQVRGHEGCQGVLLRGSLCRFCTQGTGDKTRWVRSMNQYAGGHSPSNVTGAPRRKLATWPVLSGNRLGWALPLPSSQVTSTRKGLRNQLKSLLWRKSSSSSFLPSAATDSPSATAPATPSSATAAGAAGAHPALHGGYAASSVEGEMRALSDLALMLRDADTALGTLRLLASDFKQDKAWKHYAAVQVRLLPIHRPLHCTAVHVSVRATQWSWRLKDLGDWLNIC